MPRLGEIDRARLSEEQRRVADDIQSGPRGGLAGPFWPWLRSPVLAERAQKLGEFVRYHSSLPPRLFELAVLVTAQHWKAQFEWYAHAPLAKKAGLGDDVIAAIHAGTRPHFAKPDEAAVYEFAVELYAKKRVSDATYATAVAQVGERGAVELVGVLGYYALVSMTLNAFAIEVPKGTAPPFREPANGA
jgi:4-carboxymuconolactone decarboxylase